MNVEIVYKDTGKIAYTRNHLNYDVVKQAITKPETYLVKVEGENLEKLCLALGEFTDETDLSEYIPEKLRLRKGSKITVWHDGYLQDRYILNYRDDYINNDSLFKPILLLKIKTIVQIRDKFHKVRPNTGKPNFVPTKAFKDVLRRMPRDNQVTVFKEAAKGYFD